MAGINLANNKGTLVRLSDSSLKLKNSAEDIRGHKVVDRMGDDIGDVKDLFIDERDKRVRFLEVASGGFLGIGERNFLIPVDAITKIDNDTITVSQGREFYKNAPQYDPALVDERYLNQTYGFFGYTPYWGSDYRYPNIPGWGPHF